MIPAGWGAIVMEEPFVGFTQSVASGGRSRARLSVTGAVIVLGVVATWGARAASEPAPVGAAAAVAPGDARPDLVVRDVTWSPAAPAPGDAVTFSATVANVGAGTWPADVVTGVAFLVDGEYATWSDDTRRAIPAGATVTVTANGGPAARATWTAAAGQHEVEAVVDDVSRYAESDDDNNTRSAQVTTGATPPPVPGAVSGPPGEAGRWRATFSDDFDSFDAAKWSRDWPCASGQPATCFFDSRFATHYPDRNSAVADGMLRITTNRESSAGKEFTSGVVSTVGKLEQSGGYFEIRMKPTCVEGNDPDFWLASRQTWPPEIDIAECPGGHGGGIVGAPILHAQGRGDQSRIATAPSGTRWSDDFHTYGLLWEPGKRMVGYVDGRATGEITEGVPTEPLFLIVSDEIRGGSDGGAWFGDAAKFPASATTQVDWVRVWQQA